MTLPPALAPLAEVVATDAALLRLVVPMSGNALPSTVAFLEGLDLSPVLLALAWIYVDELERAHDICQSMSDPTGSALHAIVHRREGDFSNALYWWHRAGDHPALEGLDPHGLVRA
ncbi:MAG: hypothetical protein EON93_22730, partial [Burkholderiales bacterium]